MERFNSVDIYWRIQAQTKEGGKWLDYYQYNNELKARSVYGFIVDNDGIPEAIDVRLVPPDREAPVRKAAPKGRYRSSPTPPKASPPPAPAKPEKPAKSGKKKDKKKKSKKGKKGKG